MRKSRFLRLAQILSFNLVLMLILVELVALAAYWQKSGELYYSAPPSGRSVPVDLTGGVEQFRLHPYFGFVNRPSGKLNNNHGFVSRFDYPYERRREGEYVVGIFGGSVAAELATFEARHRVLAPLLEAELGLEAGQVTVLNFGVGGFKQPQQWLIYSFFQALGQDLDLVINIDGFNEIALSGRNQDSGVGFEMPSFDHLKALRDVTGQASSLDGVERMLEIRSEWKKFARAFNRAWSGQNLAASGFLVDFLIYKYHLRRHRSLLAAHSEATGGRSAHVLPTEEAPPSAGVGGAGEDSARSDGSWLMLTGESGSEDAVAESIELWSRSSLLMARTQRAAGGLYLHFVQPNQYFDTARHFEAEERAIAFSDESVFAEFIRRDYGRLVAEVESLRDQGVSAIDLTEIFDDREEVIYKDDCCHYNDLGQRLLAEAMAQSFIALEREN